jgi:hypothetical protein
MNRIRRTFAALRAYFDARPAEFHDPTGQAPRSYAASISALHLTPEEWHDSLDAQLDELFRTVRSCERAWAIFPELRGGR